MASKKRKINRRTVSQLISIALIIGAIGIFSNVFKQVYRMYTLKQQAELVEKELSDLQDEYAALISTKNKLEDPNYVTTYARGEYMFSKGDEKVFYLPSGKKEETTDETTENSENVDVEPETSQEWEVFFKKVRNFQNIWQ